MNRMQQYEKKVIEDEEFPIQFFINSLHKKGRYFEDHWHEHLELHYIVKGQGSFSCGQKKYTAQEGSLFIINSNELHGGFLEEKEMEAVVMIFELSSFSKEVAHAGFIFENLIENDSFIQKKMKDFVEEQRLKKIGYKLSCKGMVCELIAYLMRNYALEILNTSKNRRRNKNLTRLNTVLQYIGEHYTESITNKMLADLIHISEDRFNHLFKESMDTSPLHYINQVRLKKAVNLLKTGDYTVAEVAMETGFNDINHFGRLFREKYGCTPSGMKK